MIDLRQGILLSLAIVGMFVLLLIAVFGDKGAADLVHLNQKKKMLMKQNAQLERENIELYREIDRLENDLEYIESVARQELGMVRENEIILKVQEPQKSADAVKQEEDDR